MWKMLYIFLFVTYLFFIFFLSPVRNGCAVNSVLLGNTNPCVKRYETRQNGNGPCCSIQDRVSSRKPVNENWTKEVCSDQLSVRSRGEELSVWFSVIVKLIHLCTTEPLIYLISSKWTHEDCLLKHLKMPETYYYYFCYLKCDCVCILK